MDTFKVGDRVKCIEKSSMGTGWDKLGETYEVTWVTESGLTISLDGSSYGCRADRFELVVQPLTVSSTQIGGGHYTDMAIQPYEYSLRNGLGPLEHTAIKYISRWKAKDGLKDLRKAIHTIQYLIEDTEKNGMPQGAPVPGNGATTRLQSERPYRS